MGQCELLDPENGYMTDTMGSREIYPGDVVVLGCSPGYSVSGPRAAFCTDMLLLGKDKRNRWCPLRVAYCSSSFL